MTAVPNALDETCCGQFESAARQLEMVYFQTGLGKPEWRWQGKNGLTFVKFCPFCGSPVNAKAEL